MKRHLLVALILVCGSSQLAAAAGPDRHCQTPVHAANRAAFLESHTCAIESTQWEHFIRVDSITDVRTCIVRPQRFENGAPQLGFRHGVLQWIALYGRDDPGSPVEVRVDQGPAHAATRIFAGPRAATLLRDLRTGTQVVTRYIDFPSGAPVASSFSLRGLDAEVRACDG